jgi:hypothetical protein
MNTVELVVVQRCAVAVNPPIASLPLDTELLPTLAGAGSSVWVKYARNGEEVNHTSPLTRTV